MNLILTILKYTWPYLTAFAIGIGIGGYITHKIDLMPLNATKQRLEATQSQLGQYQEANTKLDSTVRELRKELTSLNSVCSKRLKTKDEVIKKIQEIERIPDEAINSDNDPILRDLNRMYLQSN